MNPAVQRYLAVRRKSGWRGGGPISAGRIGLPGGCPLRRSRSGSQSTSLECRQLTLPRRYGLAKRTVLMAKAIAVAAAEDARRRSNPRGIRSSDL